MGYDTEGTLINGCETVHTKHCDLKDICIKCNLLTEAEQMFFHQIFISTKMLCLSMNTHLQFLLYKRHLQNHKTRMNV
jgi:hypothetical protein